ncbi:MAG: class I SAM-dependent methyltransferase [Flavobacteriaceae bacterium]|nr:class I SAM-dependent methyltransferase [Flavobacteriaceae bacterium]
MSFDLEAKDWDNDPKKVDRAELFAKEIIDFVKPNSSAKALEFGCGTGLLSFALKHSFASITLVDNSTGMIEVLKEKIVKQDLKNFIPINIDLLKEDFNQNDFDVIYTLMSLHHVVDLDAILKIFNAILKTGGMLCIADLDKEDGSFHADKTNFQGHNGFDKEELTATLLKHGFKTEYYKICTTADKEVDGKIIKYPLFLMILKKIKDI